MGHHHCVRVGVHHHCVRVGVHHHCVRVGGASFHSCRHHFIHVCVPCTPLQGSLQLVTQLYGNGNKYGRFGHAMVNLGDINSDGFEGWLLKGRILIRGKSMEYMNRHMIHDMQVHTCDIDQINHSAFEKL